MGTIDCKCKSEVTLSAVVIRADGTTEDLGIIATNKPKPILERIWDDIIKIMKGGMTYRIR